MSKLALALREEVSRVARREARRQTETLVRTSTQYRRSISELRRQLAALEERVAVLAKHALPPSLAQRAGADVENARFSVKGLRSHRKYLDLSAADYGKLLGMSGKTVYDWEHGKTHPRKRQLAVLVAVRSMGRREARARLAQLAAPGRAKP